MKSENDETEWDRRGFLKCMAWVGTGAVWTMTSGILKGMSIEQAALGGAARSGAGAGGLRFVQISDSHIGFNKDANPDVTATLRAAIIYRTTHNSASPFWIATERKRMCGNQAASRTSDACLHLSTIVW